MHGHHRLEHTGGASPCLEMADVTLSRTQGDSPTRGLAEDLGQTLDLHHIPHLRARPVRFHQGAGGGVQAGVLPGAARGQHLADRVRGGDALALAVGRAAHPTDHGVDIVAIALGVSQALEQEAGGAFAHDKAIGAVAKGPAAGGAEGADLAEFDEATGAHVAVHPAREHRIAMPLGQQLDRGVDGGQGRGAGGVGDEAGPAQVEHVGDAAGDDVGQLAGHAVFGDLRELACRPFAPLCEDRLAHGLRQLLEFGGLFQQMGVFGEGDTQAGDVVQFAAHGCAHDHAAAVGVERAVGVAIVGQGFGGDGYGPLLTFVHGCRHLGRDAVLLPVELKAAHPAADLGIAFVGDSGVGIVVVGNAPPFGRRLGDAITLVLDILPKRRGAGRLGEDGAYAHDGDGGVSDVVHWFSTSIG